MVRPPRLETRVRSWPLRSERAWDVLENVPTKGPERLRELGLVARRGGDAASGLGEARKLLGRGLGRAALGDLLEPDGWSG